MAPSPALLDVLIGLLQSMVVLLLASGVYVALAVRKEDDSASGDSKPSAAPSGPRPPRADSPAL